MEKFDSNNFSEGDKIMFDMRLCPEFRKRIKLCSKALLDKFSTINSDVQELDKARHMLIEDLNSGGKTQIDNIYFSIILKVILNMIIKLKIVLDSDIGICDKIKDLFEWSLTNGEFEKLFEYNSRFETDPKSSILTI